MLVVIYLSRDSNLRALPPYSEPERINPMTHQKSRLVHLYNETPLENLKPVILRYLSSLVHPIESWLEDHLIKARLFRIENAEEETIGFFALEEDCLRHFYVDLPYFAQGPKLLEEIIQAFQLKKVFVMTQDQKMVTLISEWNFDIEKDACFFIDVDGQNPLPTNPELGTMREALQRDVPSIRQIALDFFDDASSGFNSLEERIEAKTIFVLQESQDILGFGIVEASALTPTIVSIGMFVNPAFRRCGAARTILVGLKKWAYEKGLVPVSGCWYYNTLSRKSLESAGMIAASIGYEAVLKGKETLPLRTGNPPGELVE